MPRSALTPVIDGTVHTFTSGEYAYAVDAARAGRLVSFSLGGRNILTTAKNAEDNNWGSTFWTSPQSDWNWPPPAEIDPGAYAARISGDVLSVASAVAPGLGLSVTKEFSFDADKEVLTIEYGIINKGAQARAVGPWEISRVATGGLTFFPMGDGAPWKGFQELLPLDLRGGVAWFAAGTVAATNDQKVFADGREGWIAHVAGDLLLVKAFADTTPAQAASGEAEIELYVDPGRTYVEVENQGACVKLEPGAATTWPVRWFLRRLDKGIAAKPGSAQLLEVVRKLVAKE
jgi:hypothetical protein